MGSCAPRGCAVAVALLLFAVLSVQGRLHPNSLTDLSSSAAPGKVQRRSIQDEAAAAAPTAAVDEAAAANVPLAMSSGEKPALATGQAPGEADPAADAATKVTALPSAGAAERTARSLDGPDGEDEGGPDALPANSETSGEPGKKLAGTAAAPTGLSSAVQGEAGDGNSASVADEDASASSVSSKARTRTGSSDAEGLGSTDEAEPGTKTNADAKGEGSDGDDSESGSKTTAAAKAEGSDGDDASGTTENDKGDEAPVDNASPLARKGAGAESGLDSTAEGGPGTGSTAAAGEAALPKEASESASDDDVSVDEGVPSRGKARKGGALAEEADAGEAIGKGSQGFLPTGTADEDKPLAHKRMAGGTRAPALGSAAKDDSGRDADASDDDGGPADAGDVAGHNLPAGGTKAALKGKRAAVGAKGALVSAELGKGESGTDAEPSEDSEGEADANSDGDGSVDSGVGKKEKKTLGTDSEPEGDGGDKDGGETTGGETTDGGDAAETPPKKLKKKLNKSKDDFSQALADAEAEVGLLSPTKKGPLRKRAGKVLKDPADADEDSPEKVDEQKTGDLTEGSTSTGDDGESSAGERVAPTVVKAAKSEDSANSGVADEVALSSAEGATEAEGAPASLKADLPVAGGVSVGAPEQITLDQAAMEDEDDYASFMSELLNAGQRITPAMQALKDKTARHVVPTVQELARSSHQAFLKTSDKIKTHVTPIFGPSLSPVVSTLLSISLLLLPLALIGGLLYQFRFILTLQRLLVLCNLYLCLYCFTLLAACIIISGEPMRSLRQAAEANFFVLQIVQALAYVIYLALQIWWVTIVSRAKGKERDSLLIAKAGLSLAVALAIGLHYYIFVFERAMLDKAPKITAWGYLVYSALFLMLTLISRPKDNPVNANKTT